MPQLFLALSVLAIGVIAVGVVVVRRKRRVSGNPALPIPTTGGSESGEVDSVLLKRSRAAIATTAKTNDSVVTAVPSSRFHEASAPDIRGSVDPSNEPRTAEIEVSEKAIDERLLPRAELRPEATFSPESTPGAQPSTRSTNSRTDDKPGQPPSNERSRDESGLTPVVSVESISVSLPTADEPVPHTELLANPSVSADESEPCIADASPEPLVVVAIDASGPQTVPASEMASQATRPPQNGIAGEERAFEPDMPTDEDGEPELDLPDAVAGDEGEPELDVPASTPGEGGDLEPENVHVLDAGERGRVPRRYRPAPRLPRSDRAGAQRAGDSAAVDRPLQMAVRLSFRAGGICQFSLLAQRRPDFPEQIEARGRDRTELFRALQDDWYELKAPDNLSGLLRDGAAWTAARSGNITAKWTLTFRDIFVLGVVADFGGYVSTPRLTIGEDHVVMCVTELRQDVSAALNAAGCTDVRLVDLDSGVPDGWIVFRNVKPSRWVPATNDGDILDTLRPLANIDILLQGGIKVDRLAWLVDHAPIIRIVGDLASAGEIQIDGQPALIAADGKCISARMGDVGEHTVWSSSATRRYHIVLGMQEWPAWAAHQTPSATICGAAVLPLPDSQPGSRQVVVPAGEVSLIGAKPGTVLQCSPGISSRSPIVVVFPSFDPVWIIPRFPLRCDRSAACVRRVSSDLPSPRSAATEPQAPRDSLREWSRLILDARRRKLVRNPTDDATSSLWTEYERTARSIWRHLK